MTREQWHAARLERYQLAQWLSRNINPGGRLSWSDPDSVRRQQWHDKNSRWWQLNCLILSAGTRDPNGWRILRENHARRRSHVLARILKRKRDAMVRAPGEPLFDFIDRKCGFVRDAA